MRVCERIVRQPEGPSQPHTELMELSLDVAGRARQLGDCAAERGQALLGKLSSLRVAQQGRFDKRRRQIGAREEDADRRESRGAESMGRPSHVFRLRFAQPRGL